MPIWRGYNAQDAATTAAYALTDEKKLPEEPTPVQHPSLRERFTCLSDLKCTFSLRSLRCLGSHYWAVPLTIASLSLLIAWYICVPFFIDTDTLASKYAFEPRSVHSYKAWGITMLVLVPLLLPVQVVGLYSGGERGSRWIFYALSAAYLALIIVGNVLGSSETSKRVAFEQEFAVQFNEYYCDARILRVCLKDSQDDMLKLTRGSGSTLTAAGANATAAETTIAIWTRCQKVILDEMAANTAPIYDFLDDCNKASDVDAWCGDLLRRTTPLAVQEQRTLPAPYAANPEMFLSYTREWTKRMAMSNALLGSAAGCMTLAAWSLKVRQVSEKYCLW